MDQKPVSYHTSVLVKTSLAACFWAIEQAAWENKLPTQAKPVGYIV
jgi:hypothetical protein